MIRAAAIGLLILGLVSLGSAAGAQSRFDGWASAIIAGDWRDSREQPIDAFDNAQRDLTTAFQTAGFSATDMVSLSLRPDAAQPVDAHTALEAVTDITEQAARGCLLYFTSHGSPEGIVFGPDMELSPAAMASLMRRWCGARPTVVVVSACFSGVFVEGLSGPNRMVMTAARRDRSSFGCGAEATYPYFDGCVLQSLPNASDFIALANATRACVKRREADEGLTPGSEPQVFIGSNMQMLIPTLRFNRPDGG